MVSATIKSRFLATAASLTLFTMLSAEASSQTNAVQGQFIFSSDFISGLYAMDTTGANIYTLVPYNNFNGCNCSQGNSNVSEVTQARTVSGIAFASSHDPTDQQRIYVMNGDGTGIQQITFHDPASSPRSHAAPAISPDGTMVAFVNNEALGIGLSGTVSGPCDTTNFGALDLVNSDGTGLQQVIGATQTDPRYCNLGNVLEAAWSPDGTQLAFRHTGFPQGYGGAPADCGGSGIFVANADGSGIQYLDCDNSTYNANRGLDWSPDGTRIVALMGGGNVWNQYSPQGGVIGSIPALGAQATVIRYSPDSSQLTYVKNPTGSSDYFVTVDLSGNPVQMLDVRQKYGLVPDMGVSFWWASAPPISTPASMSLAPSPINVCPDLPVQLQTSTFDSTGALVTSGWTKAVATGISGDGASLTVDAFGTLSFTPGRDAGSFSLQLFQVVGENVASNPVTVNTSPICAPGSSPTNP